MFDFLKPKPKLGDQITLQIEGMHCSSCALSIDDSLEELDGVYESRTNFAQSTTKISYDKEKIGRTKMIKAIELVGYRVSD